MNDGLEAVSNDAGVGDVVKTPVAPQKIVVKGPGTVGHKKDCSSATKVLSFLGRWRWGW